MTAEASFHALTDPAAPAAPPAAVVGGKAAQLARLHGLGLRVPPAFAIGTAVCRDYMERGALPGGFADALSAWLARLDAWTRASLAAPGPVLLSVRSSPPISMPGMLRTIVNVGSTEASTDAIVRESGRPWFAWDTYRRFVWSFAEGVCGCPAAPFDRLLSRHLAAARVDAAADLDALSLRSLVREAAALASALTGGRWPSDRLAQTVAAVESVMRSWTSPWAVEYRRLNGIDDGTGTGVVVQAMVFGNSGPQSGSGVGFTRDPASGAREIYADFVFNAQGEDIVSGRVPIADANRLTQVLPRVWSELEAAARRLELEFQDMQDVEFTVDDARLFFLQTRAGQRSPWAAVRIAADLVREGVVDRKTALAHLAAIDLDAVSRQVARPGPGQAPVARAVPASAGCVCGAVAFDATRACRLARDRSVILVREDLDAADLVGLAAADGILTRAGGRTSHAAVVARQMQKVCLVACRDLQIDTAARACTLGGVRLPEGTEITLDGHLGLVYAAHVATIVERPDDDVAFIRSWRDDSVRGEPAADSRQPVSGGP